MNPTRNHSALLFVSLYLISYCGHTQEHDSDPAADELLPLNQRWSTEPAHSDESAADDQTTSTWEIAPVDGTVAPTVRPQPEQLDQAHKRFLDYYADEQYSRAAVAAGQAVELARAIYGDTSLEAGLALSNVATAQSQMGEYQNALVNYDASVYLIEETTGIVSPRLINPLLGLAATHNVMGNYDQGLRAYKRALKLNHVEHGLFNTEQMKIRDGLTESYIGLDDMDKAEFQQEAQANIIRQKYPYDLEKIIPATFKLAEWYRRTGQPEREQQQYQYAVNIVRQVDGNQSTQQIEALRGLASAYSNSENFPVSTRLLKQAYLINEASASPDPLLSADILIQLGDNYNSFGSWRDSRNCYISAWQILTKIEDSEEHLKIYFGTPVDIMTSTLPDLYPNRTKTQELLQEDPDLFATGSMQLSFDINEKGRVKNIRVLESDPAGLLDNQVERIVSRYNYRPRMIDGRPVTSEGIRLSHSFRYLREDEADQRDKDIDKERLDYPGQQTNSDI